MKEKPMPQEIMLTAGQHIRALTLLQCYFDRSFLQLYIFPGFVSRTGMPAMTVSGEPLTHVYGRVCRVSNMAGYAMDAAEKLIFHVAGED